jgi:beta-galactosidase GanA
MEIGQPFHILNEEILLENIDKYQVVILPDQRCISEKLAEALRHFVRRGGSLIGTVLTGTQDAEYQATGEYQLGDIFGIKLVGDYAYDHSFIDIKEASLKNDVLDMAHQAYGDCALIETNAATVLADLWEPLLMKDGRYIHLSSPPGKYTGHPAITLNQYGKGKAVFLSNDIFYAYAHRSQWNLKNLFRNILMMINPEKLIEVEAPGIVEVVLAGKDQMTQVHLVNHYREKALEGAITIVEKVLPVYDIGIKIRKETEPASVRLQPGGAELDWSYRDGYVSFHVPKLEIYSIVEIR